MRPTAQNKNDNEVWRRGKEGGMEEERGGSGRRRRRVRHSNATDGDSVTAMGGAP